MREQLGACGEARTAAGVRTCGIVDGVCGRGETSLEVDEAERIVEDLDAFRSSVEISDVEALETEAARLTGAACCKLNASSCRCAVRSVSCIAAMLACSV